MKALRFLATAAAGAAMRVAEALHQRAIAQRRREARRRAGRPVIIVSEERTYH